MIEVRGLSKRYAHVQAVDDLSFSVQPGVVTGFLGPNGSGKSTTMRLILGLDRPDSGTALIDGQRYADMRQPLRKVGALLDATSVHANRSAAAHLRWLAESNGISHARVDEVLGIVGLSDVAGKRVGGFSLGMHQRLGLAAALLGDPSVLLLDEPVNGLDPMGIRWVRTLLTSLAQEGRTVFVSSHLLAEMAQTAENLVVIGQGKLIANTTVAEFTSHSGAHTVTVRAIDAAMIDRLRVAIASAGYTVTGDAASGADGAAQRPALYVEGATGDAIGRIAFDAGIALAELTEKTASLEDAFVQSTSNWVDFAAGDAPDAAGTRGEGK